MSFNPEIKFIGEAPKKPQAYMETLGELIDGALEAEKYYTLDELENITNKAEYEEN